MKLDFHKLVATGNDFIFFEQNQAFPKENRSLWIQNLCDRKEGVGADGLVIMKPKPSQDRCFSWEFYNNDGSVAEMCGNAARCAAVYLKQIHQVENFELETSMGAITGKYKGPQDCEICLPLKKEQPIGKTIFLKQALAPQKVQGHFIKVGVPHFVIPDDDHKLDASHCLSIQNAPDFAPHKINVTLLGKNPDGSYHMKSFERGVQDFTLACGTGAIASALVLRKLLFEDQPLQEHFTENTESKTDKDLSYPLPKNNFSLQTPGGLLKVSLKEKTAILKGSARICFSGTIQLQNSQPMFLSEKPTPWPHQKVRF